MQRRINEKPEADCSPALRVFNHACSMHMHYSILRPPSRAALQLIAWTGPASTLRAAQSAQAKLAPSTGASGVPAKPNTLTDSHTSRERDNFTPPALPLCQLFLLFLLKKDTLTRLPCHFRNLARLHVSSGTRLTVLELLSYRNKQATQGRTASSCSKCIAFDPRKALVCHNLTMRHQPLAVSIGAILYLYKYAV